MVSSSWCLANLISILHFLFISCLGHFHVVEKTHLYDLKFNFFFCLRNESCSSIKKKKENWNLKRSNVYPFSLGHLLIYIIWNRNLKHGILQCNAFPSNLWLTWREFQLTQIFSLPPSSPPQRENLIFLSIE